MIRPYNRVRTILRNTDAMPRPGTCESSKNGPVFATVGSVWWAYVIRPYNWVRAIFRNTDAMPRPGTYYHSKNCLVFVPFGVMGWGVCDTPLQPGTCDSSKYRCNFSTVYLCSFKKLSCFRPLRGRGVGRIQYAPTTGYV